MSRCVQPELLDTLPPGDSLAVGSRRDLQRLNTIMCHHRIMVGALRSNLRHAPRPMTELGAGDGNFLLRLARIAAPFWPGMNVTLLDRQNCVAAATLASLRQLGWRAQAEVADVFDWSPTAGPEPVVIANLFLHHFAGPRLTALLHKISQSASLFVALEPHRFARPKLFGPLLGLLGCNAVTRHDAVVSIRAGFAGRELSRPWPDNPQWQLTERRAGLFSHLFIARRRE